MWKLLHQLLSVAIVIIAISGILTLFPQVAYAANITVTNTNDSGPGSLRQAIMDANSNPGPDTIVFDIPTSAPGYGNWTGTSDHWWKISLLSFLPEITDSVIIDGFTQTTNQGDTNPGVIGAGGTVGVDGVPLPQFEKPEIEIDADDHGSATHPLLVVNATNCTMRGLAIFNGSGSVGIINVWAGGASFTIERNFVGLRADGSEPLSTPDDLRNRCDGIRVREGATGSIKENYIGFNGEYGVVLGRSSDLGDIQATVESNELFGNGWNNTKGDNLAIYASRSTIKNNLIRDAYASGTNPRVCGGGIELRGYGTNPSNDADFNAIENNTILANPSHGIIVDYNADSNTIVKNIIANNGGPGIVIGEYKGSALKNRITQNSIYDNDGLGVDLDFTKTTQSSTSNGDGVSANDGSKSIYDPNYGINFPVIQTAILTGNILHVEGYIGTDPSDNEFVNSTVEFFISPYDGTTNPNPGVASDIAPYHGEGKTYLGTCSSSSSDNTFSCDIDISGTGLSVGDYITGTAADSDGNTSEFAENKLVEGVVIQLTKTDSPDPVYAGALLTYTITITNTGNMNATNVVVTDDYDQCRLIIIDSGGGSDNLDTIFWNIGTLATGASVSFTIIAAVKFGWPNCDVKVDNTVTATCNQGVSTSCIVDTTVLYRPVSFAGWGGRAMIVPTVSPQLDVDMWGTISSWDMHENEVLTENVIATSEDGTVAISIPEGTHVSDPDGEPLDEIRVTPIYPLPPSAPDGRYVIAAFDFEPDGAAFDSPIRVTMTYASDDLPSGVNEEDLVMAYYDEDAGEWVLLPSVVDTAAHTITGTVDHFTTFTIIGRTAPTFTLSGLSISPSTVDPGERISISVEVRNTGGLEGSYTVRLLIDGVEEATQELTLGPGASDTIDFTVTRDKSGTYEVTLAGLSGSFTVIADQFPWWAVGLGAGVLLLAVAAVAAYLMIWRRRRAAA